MDGISFQDLKCLQQLVTPPKNDSDSDSEDDGNLRQRFSRQKIGPDSIGANQKSPASASNKSCDSNETTSSVVNETLKKDAKSIWHPVEVNAIPDVPLAEDPRAVPQYEMKFKQSVGTEDLFLGINMKTTASASCEWLTLLIKLPGETREKIELSVESNIVDLRSPKYRLQLPTPFNVDPNVSSAKWHPDDERLEITLKLSRELDDVNF